MTSSLQSQSAADRVAREDLVLFINSCFASTGQSEFYGDSKGQGVSIRFLHEYILDGCLDGKMGMSVPCADYFVAESGTAGLTGSLSQKSS